MQSRNKSLQARLMRLDRVLESAGVALGHPGHPSLDLAREELRAIAEKVGPLENRAQSLQAKNEQFRREEFFADEEASRCP